MGSENNHDGGSAAQIKIGSTPKLAQALLKALRPALSTTFTSQMHVMNANECNQRGLIKDGLVKGRKYKYVGRINL